MKSTSNSKVKSIQNQVPKHAALYLRVSTAEQAREGISIDTQRTMLQSYCQLHDLDIVNEYVDAGYGGGTDKRPQLQLLLNDAQLGKFDCMLVVRLDRFYRDQRLLLFKREAVGFLPAVGQCLSRIASPPMPVRLSKQLSPLLGIVYWA